MTQSQIWIDPGTVQYFGNSSMTTPGTETVLFTPSAVASGSARISAQLDLGSGARPSRYRWRASCAWASNPTVGDYTLVGLVLADSASEIDGYDLGTSDATISTAGLLLELTSNVTLLGQITCNTAGTQAEVTSGMIEIVSRYVQVWFYNKAASKAFATDGSSASPSNWFTLQPVPDSIQAAA